LAERVFVWIGGVLFVAALALTATWYAVELSDAGPTAGWRPLVVDTLLFTAFALHHSVFARTSVKQTLARFVPERLIRSVYVWIASLLLILMCVLWRRIGGRAYVAPPPLGVALALVQAGGVWLVVRSVAAIDALELAGIRTRGAAGELQAGGPYRLVRHPLYLGWMLIVFGAANMTGDRLAFAVLSSSYLVAAIPWEERSLEAAFGSAYRRYKGRVRWRILPGVY
jgi:protein-S-isoprenylcysteine O-methyltransferase Ste14